MKMKVIAAATVSTVLATIGLLTIAATPACGGGACSGSSKCSADPATTQADINACNAAASGACGSQYSALQSCSSAQQQCTSTNTTDVNATAAAIAANCSSQTSAFMTCCASNTSAAGCSG
jgi:hypothetical protein